MLDLVSTVIERKCVKMKTATIITIYDPNPNYGNRLQNYATQQILKQEDFDVTTISFLQKTFTKKSLIKYFVQAITGYRLPGDGIYWRCDAPRHISFERFNKKYIRTRNITSLQDIDNQSDYYVVGSDQVWNANWYSSNPLKKDMFLLTFTSPEKKVCMAPSFGISELPTEWEAFFREQLMTFTNLSVREHAGAELIYKLTGRKAEVVIDPTLMLDESEWLKIIEKPLKINCEKKYILTYFLGDRTDEQNRYVQKLAKENGLEVYNLLDVNSPQLYAVSPSEFLYLIKESTLVLTDSFHACAFSFLFKRPFLVYKRNGVENKMFSRIESLLDVLSLQRKFVDNNNPNDVFECDYVESYGRLEQERIRARSFLKKSMGLEPNGEELI